MKEWPYVVINVTPETRDRIKEHRISKKNRKKYKKILETADDVIKRLLDHYEMTTQ